jgi:hypothetical protein
MATSSGGMASAVSCKGHRRRAGGVSRAAYSSHAFSATRSGVVKNKVIQLPR